VESTNGAIKLIVEHCKWGGLGRQVSIGACQRVWKHKIKWNNENQFGKLFLFYPTPVHPMTGMCTEVSYSRAQVTLFGAYIFCL
jgi:hypothetical protein